jgi:hypothetical protein
MSMKRTNVYADPEDLAVIRIWTPVWMILNSWSSSP